MIVGAHSIIYAEDAERARAFFRDILGYPYVDAHEGWLIFKLPPGSSASIRRNPPTAADTSST